MAAETKEDPNVLSTATNIIDQLQLISNNTSSDQVSLTRACISTIIDLSSHTDNNAIQVYNVLNQILAKQKQLTQIESNQMQSKQSEPATNPNYDPISAFYVSCYLQTALHSIKYYSLLNIPTEIIKIISQYASKLDYKYDIMYSNCNVEKASIDENGDEYFFIPGTSIETKVINFQYPKLLGEENLPFKIEFDCIIRDEISSAYGRVGGITIGFPLEEKDANRWDGHNSIEEGASCTTIDWLERHMDYGFRIYGTRQRYMRWNQHHRGRNGIEKGHDCNGKWTILFQYGPEDRFSDNNNNNNEHDNNKKTKKKKNDKVNKKSKDGNNDKEVFCLFYFNDIFIARFIPTSCDGYFGLWGYTGCTMTAKNLIVRKL